MVLPTTQFAAIFLLLACAGCWAVWIYASKVAIAKWRYELYYLDICVGLLVTAAGIVFTLGTLGSEMTFGDRLLVAGLTAKAWTVLGGVALALGNFLFLAALSLKDKLSPLIAVAAALVLNFSCIYAIRGGSIMVPLLVLCALLVGAVGLGVASAGAKKNSAKVSARARAISVAGGIFLGGFYPIARSGLYTDIGVGPYGALIILSISVLLSSLVFSIYFLNLPVNGPPVGLTAYRASSIGQHLSGLLGGVLYAVALTTLLLGISVGAVAS